MDIPGIDREVFRHAVVDLTGGCEIQHDGWPCGTCFGSVTDDYSGAQWHAVLAFRGDYDDKVNGDVIRMCVDIEFNPDGSFKRHVFADIPLDEIRRRVRALWKMLGCRVNV